MIDPSIITRGAEQAQLQQQQNMEMLGNLGGALGQMVLGRRINQMRQLNTPAKQQAFANNSIFSPQLNQVLQSDQATAQKNALDLLKAQAEIGKTNSEATKNNAQAGGFTLDNSQKLLSAADRALTAAAQSGNPLAAKLALSNAAKAGAITPEMYEQYNSQIDILSTQPEALKQFAQNLVLSNAKDPDKYLFSTADNQLDNQTQLDIAEANRQFDYEKLKSDDQYRRDALGQDKILAEQKIALERGDFETMTGTDGKAYAVYKDGRVEPLLLKSGEAFTPQPKGTNKETQLQMIKRKESAQNHVSASAQAASGATLAANIANRYVQGGYNPAKFALESKIPGTEAYGIAKDLESLKSNAFLSRADQMRGLGALTETEGARLISSVSPLDPMQSSEKFLTDLKNVANTFRDISKSNRDKAQLYANPNGNITNPTVAPAESTEQNVTIPKGAYMTLSDVKASAMNAGISVKEAIQRLQSKGVTIR
ncbi:TPA: hypothetical protein JI157_15480 [Acinetobacter baumannii]|nr:hypothetical protein [Acinetobacter baumannii]